SVFSLAGGIIGSTSSYTSISNSYTTGEITGNSMGGLVAENYGTILNSYYNSTLNGNNGIATDGEMGKNETWFTEENLLAAGITNTTGVIDTGEVVEPTGPVITTAAELQKALANNWDISLGGDIDLSSITDWSNTTTYTGTFEGNNYTISNLTSTTQGLFAEINGGTVQNLKLENFNITSSDNEYGVVIGGLANYANNATINNVHVLEGSISTNSCTDYDFDGTGGLIGFVRSNTEISNCSSSASVLGEYNVGGLIGFSDYANIVDSYSTGNVSGHSYVGGLVGKSSDDFTTIDSCYATGDITGYASVGGFLGSDSDVKITNSYSSGNVTGEYNACGFVGCGGTSVKTTNCYYNSSNGTTDSSGAVGKEATWFNQANTSAVVGYATTAPEVVGPTTPTPEPEGPVVVTTVAQLQEALANNKDISLEADLNLAGIDWSNTTTYTGTFEGNNHTISNLTSLEDGLFSTIDGGTVQNLKLQNFNVGVYENGVDAGGALARETNNVTINNVHTIEGTVYSDLNCGGMIGIAYGDTIIQNSSSSTKVTEENGGTGLIGGFIGYGYSGSTISIENSYATGDIGDENSSEVGGLVGLSLGEVNINNCYSSGEITGYNSGGIIGYSTNTTITNSYSTGKVSGDITGGLVGENGATITNSYYNSTLNTDNGKGVGKDETWFTEENLLAVGITNTGGALNIEEPDPTPDPEPEPDPTPEPDEPDTPVVP
ncbi:hypothetical protein IKA92_06485, partial [bacterium]|nr:hypothetical protein [bacterium]